MGFSMGRGTLIGVGYIAVTADTAIAESSLGKLGIGLAGAATATLALGAAAGVTVKMASDFNTQMLKIQTQAGGTSQDVKSLSASILGMKDVQQSPVQLAEAMYHLKSVGLDNVSAMQDLKVASDLAAVGGSDLEQTTNALAGAWRSGIIGAQSFSMAAGTVNAIIGAGNMKMQDFVSAIGTGILPAAKTFGVSLTQVGAALALMTDEGVPAVDAATRLKMSFSLLAAPSGAASKQLAKIGLTGLELANTMRGPTGLVGAIQLLKDHLDASGMSLSQQAILLSHAFGGGRSSSAILTMINNVDVLHGKLDQINTSSGALDGSIKAQQATPGAQFKMLISGFRSLGIQIGESLIGPVTAFVTFLNNAALPTLERFAASLATPLKNVGASVSSLSSTGFFKGLMGAGSALFGAVSQHVAPPPVTFTPQALTSTRLQIPGYMPGAVAAPALGATAYSLQVPSAPVVRAPSVTGSELAVPAEQTVGKIQVPLTSMQKLGQQIGTELKPVFSDIPKIIDEVARAFLNLAQASGPLLQFLATVGFAALKTVADVLANVIGPALVKFTEFVKDNKGWITTLIEIALIPLGIRLAALAVLKPIGAIAGLAADIVKFPFQQSRMIWDSLSAGADTARGVWGGMRMAAVTVWGGITGAAGKAAPVIKGALQDVAQQAVYAGRGISTLATNAGKAVSSMASSAWSGATSGLQTLGTKIGSAASSLGTLTTNAGKAVASMAASAWSGAVSGAQSVGTALAGAATAAWGWVTAAAASTAAAVKQAAIWVAQKVAMLASAAAEGIATAAQWLLNLAMNANPISLIIIGIAALVAGIVWVATKTTWFQTAWKFTWDAIMAVWHWVWDNVLKPQFEAWGMAFDAIGKAASWLYDGVLKPVFKFIVDIFLNLVSAIINGAADAFGWIPGLGGKLKSAAKWFNDFSDQVNASLGGIQPKTVPVEISFNGVPQGSITGHTYTSTTGFSYASGGPIPLTAGTRGKDSVLILAEPGEFIVNTKDAQKNRALLTAINTGKIRKMAGGGMVGFINAAVADTDLAGRMDISQETTKIVSDYVKANNAYASSLGGNIPTGQQLGIIDAALAAAGVPPPGSQAQWEAGLNTLITRESGWNASAINLTDCTTLDTVILTQRGWLKHDEVQVGDYTIGYNMATGTSEWTRVMRVVHYADAPLVRMYHSRWSSITTPNHRWVNFPREAVPAPQLPDACHLCPWPQGTLRRGKTTRGGMQIHLSKVHGIRPAKHEDTYAQTPSWVTTDAVNSRSRILLAAPAVTPSSLDITVQEAAVLGWIAGDGHVETRKYGPSMSIAQSKPAMVDKLRVLLDGLPYADHVDERLTRTGKVACGPRHQFRFEPSYAQDLLRRAGHPKTDAVQQVLAMSTEQRAAWLEAMIDAEGHRQAYRGTGEGKATVSLAQCYGPVLEAITIAVYLSGSRPRVTDRKVDRVVHPTWNPSATVAVNNPILTGSFLHKEDAGFGDVWCVTTELGSWTARDGDHVFLTGNSNALAGHPSQGLAQTIPSTFNAYVPSSLASAGILNPIANVAAAVRYIVATYGNISNVQQANANLPPLGYDFGGRLPTGMSKVWNGTGRPELILNPRQEAAMNTAGGATELHVHFHGPVGSPRELENWLVAALTNAKRSNRLTGIVPAGR